MKPSALKTSLQETGILQRFTQLAGAVWFQLRFVREPTDAKHARKRGALNLLHQIFNKEMGEVMKCSKCNRSTKVALWTVPTKLEQELLGMAITKTPFCKIHLEEKEGES